MPRAGYDIHHIVEQTPAAQDGYRRHMIDGPENLVRIPRLKHQNQESSLATASAFMKRKRKLPIRTGAAAALSLMVSQAMSQNECNFFRIAEDYIASRYPFIDLAVRHPITSEVAGVWEVRYELPAHMLGFVPVIGIDRRSCRIVRAEVEQ